MRTFKRLKIELRDSRGELYVLDLDERQFNAQNVLTETASWLASVTHPEDWPQQASAQDTPAPTTTPGGDSSSGG